MPQRVALGSNIIIYISAAHWIVGQPIVVNQEVVAARDHGRGFREGNSQAVGATGVEDQAQLIEADQAVRVLHIT